VPAAGQDPQDEVVFIGDLHRQWRHVVQGLAVLSRKPRAAVLLGDMECDRPLDRVAAPLLDAGIAVHWIWGNHDYDGGAEMWANLVDRDRNPRTGAGSLNARVATIGGVRVAGLGGTFRRRVWEPPSEPRLRGRAELDGDVAALGPDWTEAQRQAMAHALAAMAIWPEDVEALAALRAEVLVTHEAPSSHPQGFAAIDELARRIGARLVIHGHHHVCYRARAENGLEVQGVGAGWAVGLDGRPWWRGEPDRWLGPAPLGWTHL
jgi:predicted phosphodiesterase